MLAVGAIVVVLAAAPSPVADVSNYGDLDRAFGTGPGTPALFTLEYPSTSWAFNPRSVSDRQRGEYLELAFSCFRSRGSSRMRTAHLRFIIDQPDGAIVRVEGMGDAFLLALPVAPKAVDGLRSAATLAGEAIPATCVERPSDTAKEHPGVRRCISPDDTAAPTLGLVEFRSTRSTDDGLEGVAMTMLGWGRDASVEAGIVRDSPHSVRSQEELMDALIERAWSVSFDENTRPTAFGVPRQPWTSRSVVDVQPQPSTGSQVASWLHWMEIALVVWFLAVAFGISTAAQLSNAGRWAAALNALRLTRYIAGRIAHTPILSTLNYSGRTTESIAFGSAIESRGMGVLMKNTWICTLITAGQYRRAVAFGDEYETRVAKNSVVWPLIQVNLAEAEYNLGRWTEALTRLDELRSFRPTFDPMTECGERLQRAWILAHLGRSDGAQASFETASETALPSLFRAEYHYTAAAVALASSKYDAALAATEAGLELAVRVSSLRNGVFLRARVRAARGEYEQALVDFTQASVAEYRAQGGDGLLGMGDVFHQLGRVQEARAAWKMAIERDAESESAAAATLRLT